MNDIWNGCAVLQPRFAPINFNFVNTFRLIDFSFSILLLFSQDKHWLLARLLVASYPFVFKTSYLVEKLCHKLMKSMGFINQMMWNRHTHKTTKHHFWPSKRVRHAIQDLVDKFSRCGIFQSIAKHFRFFLEQFTFHVVKLIYQFEKSYRPKWNKIEINFLLIEKHCFDSRKCCYEFVNCVQPKSNKIVSKVFAIENNWKMKKKTNDIESIDGQMESVAVKKSVVHANIGAGLTAS